MTFLLTIMSITGLVFLGIGYVCGSIPFGLLIAKLGGAGDVRSIGSGNIGATNVLRTGRKGLAAATLLADALKGVIPTAFAMSVEPKLALTAGLGAFLGHLFPIWLRFKGGKGIATFLGVLAAFSWKALLVFAVAWLATAFLTRYSSAGALVATVAATVALWAFGLRDAATLFATLTALAWFMHRSNISRLLSGTEGKIGAKG
ncbi:MAG: glycerol-3-phosphate 1-O-acyltransferase PlsY [Pseudomonadota bacterium]